MNCPKCGSNNIYVKDSRHRDGYVYRRRVCAECGEEFSTHEKIVVDMKLNSKKSEADLCGISYGYWKEFDDTLWECSECGELQYCFAILLYKLLFKLRKCNE